MPDRGAGAGSGRSVRPDPGNRLVRLEWVHVPREAREEGRVVIPQTVLDRLGLVSGEALLVEVSDDGAIVLRPIGDAAVELYTEGRVREFLEENGMPAALRDQAQRRATKAAA